MLARAGAAAMQSARRAGPGPWDPSQRADAEAWYRPDSYAGGVAIDLSGNGRDISQASEPMRPSVVVRNGQVAWGFSGGQWLRGVFGAPVAQPLTIYIVAEQATSATQFYVDGDVGAGRNAFVSASEGLQMNSGTALNGPPPAPGTRHAHALVFNGALSEMFALSDFASPAASGQAGIRPSSGLTLGASYADTAPLNGYVWELILVSAADDAAARAQMGAYLAARYSIPIVT